jgi:hypothetical protein
VLVATVLWWLALLARSWAPGWRGGIAIVLGAALGVLAVGETRRFTPHPKAERNLAYILRQWEPPRDRSGDAESVVLERAPPRSRSR